MSIAVNSAVIAQAAILRTHGSRPPDSIMPRAKFPLTGAHATVACAKCHVSIPDAKPYVKYTGLSFDKCTACHTDPHKGSFTAPCQSCHNTTSWTRVAQTGRLRSLQDEFSVAWQASHRGLLRLPHAWRLQRRRWRMRSAWIAIRPIPTRASFSLARAKANARNATRWTDGSQAYSA